MEQIEEHYDYNFKQQDYENDIQYAFEQLQDKQELSFSCKLNPEMTLILGKYLKIISNVQVLKIKLYQNQIGPAGLIGLSQGFLYFKNLMKFSIEIEKNNIQTEGMLGLSKGISQISSLKKLYINIGESNYINEDGGVFLGNAISKLIELEVLKLVIQQKNEIGIKGTIQIGKGIKQLQKLKNLTLTIEKINHIEQDVSLGIFEGFQNLNLLKLKLSFPQNKIGYQDGFQLSQSLQNMKELRKLQLNIAENHAETQGSNKMGLALKNLKKLIKLFLEIGHKNHIGIVGAEAFGIGISKLEKLEDLTIILHNKIGSFGTLKFFQGIQNLINLKKLYIEIGDSKDIKIEGAQGIAEGLKNLKALINLSLIIGYKNHIQADGAIGIGNAIKNLKQLKILKLIIQRDNEIQMKGAQAIGESFYNLVDLEILSINFGDQNRISSNGLQFLSEGLSKIPMIKELSFIIGSENDIDHNGFIQFYQNINKLINLQKLEFSIGSCDIKSIGNVYSNMKNLNQLAYKIVSENHIVNSAGIGEGFSNLNNLRQLSIEIEQGNQIGKQGALNIAKGLQHLISLKNLKIHIGYGNKIESEGIIILGEGIAMIKNLEYLSLSVDENNIGAESMMGFSGQISKLVKLKHLNIYLIDPHVLSMIQILKNNKILTSETLLINHNRLQFQKITKEEQKILKIPYYFNLNIQLKTIEDYGVLGIIGFCMGLKQLKNLTTLIVDFNLKFNLNKTTITEFSQALGNLEKLIHLKVNFEMKSQFCDDCMRKLCEGIKQLENLISLDLSVYIDSYENSKSCGAINLGSVFKKLQKLKSLKLVLQRNPELDSKSLIKIGEGIKSIPDLTDLNFQIIVYHKNVKDIINYKEWYSSHKNLKSLSIDFARSYLINQQIQSINSLITVLNNHPQLISLQITNSHHFINILNIQQLIETLSKLVNLKYLVIQNFLDQRIQNEISNIVIKKSKRLVTKRM